MLSFDFQFARTTTSRAVSRAVSLDANTKDIVGERIAACLYLDKPKEVINRKKGFYVPFHMKDGLHHSPEMQVQPEVKVKTVELEALEKEYIHRKMKVTRILKQLGRSPS